MSLLHRDHRARDGRDVGATSAGNRLLTGKASLRRKRDHRRDVAPLPTRRLSRPPSDLHPPSLSLSLSWFPPRPPFTYSYRPANSTLIFPYYTFQRVFY